MSFFKTSLVVGFLMVAFSVSAQTCVDIQTASDRNSAENKWILTNTCKEAVDLSIKREGGDHRVCTILHIEPGASRNYTQAKVCGSTNALITGCSCMNSFTTLERRLQ
jgi:hypothetical protein